MGQVGDNRFIHFDIHMLAVVDDSDILVFMPPAGPLRCGALRARHAKGWLSYNCGITALAPLDVVYRATAIGEHAFKRGDACGA